MTSKDPFVKAVASALAYRAYIAGAAIMAACAIIEAASQFLT